MSIERKGKNIEENCTLYYFDFSPFPRIYHNNGKILTKLN